MYRWKLLNFEIIKVFMDSQIVKILQEVVNIYIFLPICLQWHATNKNQENYKKSLDLGFSVSRTVLFGKKKQNFNF